MINVERMRKGIEARDFFLKLLNAPCEKIAVENPLPMGIFMLPEATQFIQPYEFGHKVSKKTCLWLKGLPKLKPTEIVSKYSPYINGGGGRTERENYKGQKFANGGAERSKTFWGIARAMAEQWG